jgi:hypothetical protein
VQLPTINCWPDSASILKRLSRGRGFNVADAFAFDLAGKKVAGGLSAVEDQHGAAGYP